MERDTSHQGAAERAAVGGDELALVQVPLGHTLTLFTGSKEAGVERVAGGLIFARTGLAEDQPLSAIRALVEQVRALALRASADINVAAGAPRSIATLFAPHDPQAVQFECGVVWFFQPNSLDAWCDEPARVDELVRAFRRVREARGPGTSIPQWLYVERSTREAAALSWLRSEHGCEVRYPAREGVVFVAVERPQGPTISALLGESVSPEEEERVQRGRALALAQWTALEGGDLAAVSTLLKELRSVLDEHDPNEEQRTHLANALLNASVAATRAGDSAAADALLAELRLLVSRAQAPELQRQYLAVALVNAHRGALAGTRNLDADAIQEELRNLASRAAAKEPQRTCLAESLFNSCNHGAKKALALTGSHLQELRSIANRAEAPETQRNWLAMALFTAHIGAQQRRSLPDAEAILDELRAIVRRKTATEEQATQLAMALDNARFEAEQRADRSTAARLAAERSHYRVRAGYSGWPAKPQAQAALLVNEGIQLMQAGNLKEAVEVFEEVVERFASGPAFDFRDQAVSTAMFNRACLLGYLGRAPEELTAYDELAERFGNAEAVGPRHRAAMALVNKALKLAQLGKLEEAVRENSIVLTRFGDAPEIQFRAQIALALFNRGWVHGLLSRLDNELRDYDEAITRFANATDVETRREVASAMHNKAVNLARQGRSREAVRTCEEMEQLFEKDSDPKIRNALSKALENKAHHRRALGG